MAIYYHLTRARLLSKILRQGLRPRSGEVTFDDEEGIQGIFLAEDPAQAFAQLEYPWNVHIRPASRWALLQVDLPASWSLHRDNWDYPYSLKAIPPKHLKVVKVFRLNVHGPSQFERQAQEEYRSFTGRKDVALW